MKTGNKTIVFKGKISEVIEELKKLEKTNLWELLKKL